MKASILTLVGQYRRLHFRCWILLLILAASCCVTAAGETNCAVSQATFDADWRNLAQHPNPSHLPLMGVRYVDLLRAQRGLACSGVPLVAFDGLRYRPAAAWSDDPGLYLLVPELARLTGLNIADSADVLVASSVVLAGLVGLWGFLKTAKTVAGRCIGMIAFLLMVTQVFRVGQVYALGVVPAIACAPWIVFFALRERLTLGSILTMAVSGVLAAIANAIRSHSGLALLIFAGVMAFGVYKVRLTARVLTALALLAGLASGEFVLHHIYDQRDEFLRHQAGAVVENAGGHVFWHSVYIGFAFVGNSDVPAYRDDVAFGKAYQMRPEVAPYTPEYEQVMRDQVLELARKRPALVAGNVALKVVIIFLYCLLFTNVGLYAAVIVPKEIAVESAFLLAIGMGALPGILVVPVKPYILGGIVFCVIYAAFGVDYALQNTEKKDRFRWVRQIMFMNPVFPES